MSVKTIKDQDLRRMSDREGLVLQGCGGDLTEWENGINDILTKEGILLENTRFSDCYGFEHEGVTCLLFPFPEDVKVNAGKLAIWRLRSHEFFGGTWLSDYVPQPAGRLHLRKAGSERPEAGGGYERRNGDADMSDSIEQKKDVQAAVERYFWELSLNLDKAGYSAGTLEDGKLPVTWHGKEICRVDANRTVFFDSHKQLPEEWEQALKVMDTVKTVGKYMRLLEAAPLIQAAGLNRNYRQLCEHDGIILAGRSTRFGAEFVTWEWIDDHKSLWQGHYFTNYPAAKQDFAVRSGLIQSDRLLTEVYCAIRECLDSGQPCSDHRREILESVRERIDNCVQDLEQKVQASEENEYSMRPGQWPEME